MTPENIATHKLLALTEAQRTLYFENDFVAIDGLVLPEWVKRLSSSSNEFFDGSRALTESNDAFDLGAEHSAKRPHVSR